MRDSILKYFNSQKLLNQKKLKSKKNKDPIKKMKLIDRVSENEKHIEVIKRMYPAG